jgi:hypothetical protein
MTNVHFDELAVKYGGLDAITTELGNQAKRLEGDLEALKSAVVQAAQPAGRARRPRPSARR